MSHKSSEMTWPTVHLRHGEAQRIQSGHPWVYVRNVNKVTQEPEDGGVVQVRDHRRRFLGLGLYNSKSKIRVRLISRSKVEVNQAFFESRLQTALDWRQKHLGDRDCFRLVNAESDGLSGLIVDHYDGTLVVQTSSLGMDQRLPQIVRALTKLMDPKCILERNDSTGRRMEGLEERNSVLYERESGESNSRLTVKMNDLEWAINVEQGHKTAVYLDQYENYQKIANLVSRMKAPKVLDCFSFMGGFGLHCAKAGAKEVTFIDQSEEALDVALSNATANGLADRCEWVHGNVFDWLKVMTGKSGEESEQVDGPRYDLIILDPPSFTRNRASVPDALRGYKEIHLRAMRLLKPDGVLATFCCSHHIDPLTFEGTVLDAAFDNRCTLRRVDTYGQPADHPIVPSIPETEYLKGFAYQRLDF
ncbi:MAG: class I SAM-dependent rRNA methyltransferase [Verrucomicrobia bacterium]|jgi:23S rRNA (cytosine1962-C5)-methyltransferase|nr:class I SAM-dependent rRNA methyltransferase [Verrucomicrobiota bacterium]